MVPFSIKNTVYTLLLGVLFFSASAQNEEDYKKPSGLNNWYLELGGSALFYSLNYEKILIKDDRWGWIGRIGLGYNPKENTFLNKVTLADNTIMAPFHSSVLYGPNKEKLELGFGFTLLAQGVDSREIVPTAVLGFRVIETNKVCFRAAWTPFIRNGEFVSWFGVSLGRNFSLGK